MNVFISWSGDRSKAVAELLKLWIKCVLQSTQPWISTSDIDPGSIWFSSISTKLADTRIGIVCLTQDNKNNPWILFEAGALSKGLPGSKICTLLIDLKPEDIKDPLAQFNHTIPDRQGILSLIRSINSRLPSPLDDPTLENVFSTYWDQFDSGLKNALDSNPSGPSEKRDEGSMLSEVLNVVRSLSHRINSLESYIQIPTTNPLLSKSTVKRKGFPSSTESITMLRSLLNRGVSTEDVISLARKYDIPIELVTDPLPITLNNNSLISDPNEYSIQDGS